MVVVVAVGGVTRELAAAELLLSGRFDTAMRLDVVRLVLIELDDSVKSPLTDADISVTTEGIGDKAARNCA